MWLKRAQARGIESGRVHNRQRRSFFGVDDHIPEEDIFRVGAREAGLGLNVHVAEGDVLDRHFVQSRNLPRRLRPSGGNVAEMKSRNRRSAFVDRKDVLRACPIP